MIAKPAAIAGICGATSPSAAAPIVESSSGQSRLRTTLAGLTSGSEDWVRALARSAAIGFGLILTVGVYVMQIFGLIGYVLEIAIVVFLIWTIPAAAIGGIPGGASIQVSIDRVRSSPPAAIIVAVVSFALIAFAVPYAASWLDMLASTWVSGSARVAVVGLIQALLQAIAVGYIALVLTKTYTDNAFGRRW